MKTLQIDWPENHCFLQNIWFHYKTRVCTSLISLLNRENMTYTGHTPPLFRRGNFKGDAFSDEISSEIHGTAFKVRRLQIFLDAHLQYPNLPFNRFEMDYHPEIWQIDTRNSHICKEIHKKQLSIIFGIHSLNFGRGNKNLIASLVQKSGDHLV